MSYRSNQSYYREVDDMDITDDFSDLDHGTDLLFEAISAFGSYLDHSINDLNRERPVLYKLINNLESLAKEFDQYDPDYDRDLHNISHSPPDDDNIRVPYVKTPKVPIPNLSFCYCKPDHTGRIIHRSDCKGV